MFKATKKVWELHKDLIAPGIGAGEHRNATVKSVSWTPETLIKMDVLKKKYGLSRSAIVRILVDSVALASLEKKLENKEKVEEVYGETNQ